MNVFRKIIETIRLRKLFVVLDPADNSITLSKHLFRHIKNNVIHKDKANVFVFKIKDANTYGFVANHDFQDEETQLCCIQYNEKHKTVGFESLCPSVGRILYDYNLPSDKKVKLSVSFVKANNDCTDYYIINRPPCRA